MLPVLLVVARTRLPNHRWRKGQQQMMTIVTTLRRSFFKIPSKFPDVSASHLWKRRRRKIKSYKRIRSYCFVSLESIKLSLAEMNVSTRNKLYTHSFPVAMASLSLMVRPFEKFDRHFFSHSSLFLLSSPILLPVIVFTSISPQVSFNDKLMTYSQKIQFFRV